MRARGGRAAALVVTRTGDEPERGGSVAGAVHRGWMNLKAAVAGRDDVAILEECERGEDVAKASYRKALEMKDLPADVRAAVQKQYDGVVRNHDQIRDLRKPLPRAGELDEPGHRHEGAVERLRAR
jgi:uncharacterized protein (TIGR02284 family)